MFLSDELKSLEIKPSENIFLINGHDFGKYCDKYDIEIYQDHGEIAVVFRRHGTTVWKNIFDAGTGKIKSHFQKKKVTFNVKKT